MLLTEKQPTSSMWGRDCCAKVWFVDMYIYCSAKPGRNSDYSANHTLPPTHGWWITVGIWLKFGILEQGSDQLSIWSCPDPTRSCNSQGHGQIKGSGRKQFSSQFSLLSHLSCKIGQRCYRLPEYATTGVKNQVVLISLETASFHHQLLAKTDTKQSFSERKKKKKKSSECQVYSDKHKKKKTLNTRKVLQGC